MEKPVIILGGSGIARAAGELFRSHDIVVFCYLDDDEKLHGTEIDEIPVLGRTDDDGFLKYIGKKCEAFVATDDTKLKKSLVNLLNERRKVMPVNASHKASVLASSMSMGHGNYISSGVHVGSGTTLGNHGIFHTGSIIESGVTIGDYVQVGTRSVINSDCKIEDEVFIGSGAVVVAGVTIGKGARIGAGSVVINNVASGKTVFGNPAKEVG